MIELSEKLTICRSHEKKKDLQLHNTIVKGITFQITTITIMITKTNVLLLTYDLYTTTYLPYTD